MEIEDKKEKPFQMPSIRQNMEENKMKFDPQSLIEKEIIVKNCSLQASIDNFTQLVETDLFVDKSLFIK